MGENPTETLDIDPEAPYGRKPDGTPYKMPPEWRERAAANMAAGRTAKAARRRDQADDPPRSDDPPAFGETPLQREPDRAPGHHRHGRRLRRGQPEAPPKPPEEIPPIRPGVIARGMNRLYARAGRIVRVFHPPIGEAIISTTRKESEDDVTVGDAWEEYARVKPVWRKRLEKVVQGGAAAQLAYAHLPILIAIVMIERIRSRIPMWKLVEAFLADDGTWVATSPGQPAEPGPSAADVQDMMAFAASMMDGMFAGQRPPTVPRAPVIVDVEGSADDESRAA